MVQLTSNDSCGAIIIKKKKDLDFLNYEVAVTQGISKKGYSFPKGHLENNETPLETTYREVHEESGLKKDDYKIIRELGIINVRPGRNVFFYLAILNEDKENIILEPFDKTQTFEAFWVTVKDIIDKNTFLKGGQFDFFMGKIEEIKSSIS
eukprot:gene10135-2554_t